MLPRLYLLSTGGCSDFTTVKTWSPNVTNCYYVVLSLNTGDLNTMDRSRDAETTAEFLLLTEKWRQSYKHL